MKAFIATRAAALAGLIVFGLAGCAAKQPAGDSLTRLEYYQRMTRSEFKSAHAWLPQALAWLDPAAHAEIPPQYQSAFSLVLEPLAGEEAIDAEYHFQMVTDDSTHKHARLRLGAADYRRLQALAQSKLACESSVEQGWAGPAPVMLSLQYSDRSDTLYVGGPDGPDGPSRELSEQNKRRYLCSDALKAYLDEVLGRLESK